MNYSLLVVLTAAEPGRNEIPITSQVVSFDHFKDADTAAAKIEAYFPKHAIYAEVVKLYD